MLSSKAQVKGDESESLELVTSASNGGSCNDSGHCSIDELPLIKRERRTRSSSESTSGSSASKASIYVQWSPSEPRRKSICSRRSVLRSRDITKSWEAILSVFSCPSTILVLDELTLIRPGIIAFQDSGVEKLSEKEPRKMHQHSESRKSKIERAHKKAILGDFFSMVASSRNVL